MFKLIIPDSEYFNDDSGEFFTIKGMELSLEHSLVSLSKWESKWLKPFLSKVPKTFEETIDYVQCMTITQNVPDYLYKTINSSMISKINEYIEHPMSATRFSKDESNKINREVITAEIIYYWMVTFNIPFECQKWHLNRLLTLINVCNIKNQPNKKMSKKSLLARNRALNEARKRQLGTTG